MTAPYVWTPDAATIDRANVTRLMRRMGIEVDPSNAARG
jgi:hypothetical protein